MSIAARKASKALYFDQVTHGLVLTTNPAKGPENVSDPGQAVADIASRLVFQMPELQDGIQTSNNIQEWSFFKKPVRPEDQIFARLSVRSTDPRSEGDVRGQVTFNVQVVKKSPDNTVDTVGDGIWQTLLTKAAAPALTRQPLTTLATSV